MESDNALYAFRTMPASHPSRAERLLLRVPIFVAVAFGLVFMVGRFVLVLSEHLKQPPGSWGAVLLLAMLVGTVSLVVVAACAVGGFAISLVLLAAVRRISRQY
jgi:hypothetical protein